MSDLEPRLENPNQPARPRRPSRPRDRTHWWRDLTISLVAGTLGVLATLLVLDGRQDPPPAADPGDRVAAATAALRASSVVVSPEARDMLSEEGERRVEAALERAPVPVRVLVWRETRQDGAPPYYQLAPLLAEELDADLPEPGIVVVWTGPEAVTVDVRPDLRLDYEVRSSLQAAGAAELRLVEFAAGLRPGIIEADDDEDWGGVGDGIAAGLLIAAGVLIAVPLLALLIRALMRSLLSARSSRSPT